MDEKTKLEILNKAKTWWRDELAVAHRANTAKLVDLKQFDINPFLMSYLAYYLEGNNDPRSIAKALVYPRVLGTSITTSFGTRVQSFITRVTSDSSGSTTEGIDLEFEDKLDHRKKYCQLKAGPNVINRDDVTTINRHFAALKNRARTNNLDIRTSDMIFGLIYGEPHEKNGFVREVERDYVVSIGQDFWYRFTGDPNFYADLITSIGEVANEFDMKDLVEEVINELAKKIADEYPELV